MGINLASFVRKDAREEANGQIGFDESSEIDRTDRMMKGYLLPMGATVIEQEEGVPTDNIFTKVPLCHRWCW